MMNGATLNKLHDMRLSAMAEAYRQQLSDPAIATLEFEERFGLLVDAEWSRRKSNRLNKLIRKADLQHSSAAIENIEYHADRKLDKGQIARLAGCAYITEKHNIIILGASGSGKTYLSCAFGIAACRNFYTVKYVRLPDLLNEMAVARGEGIYQKVRNHYQKVSLLILDEWLLLPLTSSEARDVLEIVEARHKRASTIFSSQFAPAGWHGKIGEGILSAILE